MSRRWATTWVGYAGVVWWNQGPVIGFRFKRYPQETYGFSPPPAFRSNPASPATTAPNMNGLQRRTPQSSFLTLHVRRAALALCVLVLHANLGHAESLRRSAIVRAVERAKPSVVNITGQKLVARDDQYSHEKKRVNGMGTGVVVDPRGYILTNYHVVEGVRRIRVTLANGQAYIARLVAHDPTTDLAIVKIPVRYRMPVVRVGSSKDIMTGETVIAVGNAYGYEHTVTTGIVSAQHRNVQVNETQAYQDLIQTDASINPGNSGGPLLNIDGDMIGINVAVRVGAQGIGFAIPVDQGMQVAARLMSVERITGLWHGLIHEDESKGETMQVVVRRVVPGSPAEKAGIRQGDVIQQVGGKRVGRGLDVECALIGNNPGQSVEFEVNRDNRPVAVQLGLATKSGNGTRQHEPVATKTKKHSSRKPHGVEQAWHVLGLELVKVPKSAVGVGEFRGGLQVRSVKRNSLAAENGIQRNDVLVGVHVWETVSKENLDYILSEADLSAEESVPFYVVRNGETLRGQLEVSKMR